MGVAAQAVVWCGVGAQIPFAIEHPAHKPARRRVEYLDLVQ